MAQSNLPACQGPDTTKWDQCIGSETFNVDGKMVSRYLGEYASGTFNGQGAMTFASGLRFVGNFKAGLRNGDGVEYNKDGSLARSGTWEGPMFKTWPVKNSLYPFDWEASLTATLAAAGNNESSSPNRPSSVPANNLATTDITKCPINFRLSFTDGNQACLTELAIADALVTGTKESVKSSLNYPQGSLHVTLGNASCPALFAVGAKSFQGPHFFLEGQTLAHKESKSRCQRLLSERGIQENSDCLCSELIGNGRVATTLEGLRVMEARWASLSAQPSPIVAAAPPASSGTPPPAPPISPVSGQALIQNNLLAINVSNTDLGKCPVNLRLSFEDARQACLTDFAIAEAVVTGTNESVKSTLSRPHQIGSLHITLGNPSCPALIAVGANSSGQFLERLNLARRESKGRCQRLLSERGIQESPDCLCTELIADGRVASTREGLQHIDARWARQLSQPSSIVAAASPASPGTATPAPPILPVSGQALNQNNVLANNVSNTDLGKCPANLRLSFDDASQGCLTDFSIGDALVTGTQQKVKSALDRPHLVGSLYISRGNSSCPVLLAMGVKDHLQLANRQGRLDLARTDSKTRCQRLLSERGIQENPDCLCTELIGDGRVAMTREGLQNIDARWARQLSQPSPIVAAAPLASSVAATPTPPNLPITGQAQSQNNVLANNVNNTDIGKCPANFRLSFTEGNQACLTDFAIAEALVTGTKQSVKNSLSRHNLISSLHITLGNASCPAFVAVGDDSRRPIMADREIRQNSARTESKNRCQRLLSERGIQENPDCLCTELIGDGRVAMTREGLQNIDARWARQLSQPSPIVAAAPLASSVAATPTPPNLPITGQAQSENNVLANNASYTDIGKCPVNLRLSFTDGNRACLTDFGLSEAVISGSNKTVKNTLDSRPGSMHITIGNASCPALISYFDSSSSNGQNFFNRPTVQRESKRLCQRFLSDQGFKETSDCQCTELITNGSVAMTRDELRNLDSRWTRQLPQTSPVVAAAPPASSVAAPITPPNLPVTGQAQNQKMAQELAQLEQRLQQDRSDRLKEVADATQAKRELEERLKSEAALRQQERQARESSEQKIRQEQAERDRLAAENARLRAELEAARQTSSNSKMAFRKALVIGIDGYKHIPRLATARQDAQAMTSSLSAAGFTVSQYLDIGEKDMRAALRKFAAEVEGGDEVAIFFAGHGVQLGGLNYLIPMDVSGESEGQLREDAIPLQRILDDMSDRKAKLTLAVIDACRDNPFRTAGRSIGNASRGLSPTTPATGQIVIFSAGNGQRALDSLGPQDRDRNGVFTRVFAQEMRKRGVPIDQVVRSARTEVVRLARSIGHEQVPAIYDQLVGEFILMK